MSDKIEFILFTLPPKVKVTHWLEFFWEEEEKEESKISIEESTVEKLDEVT